MALPHNVQRAHLPGPAVWGSRCELLTWHGRLDNRGDLVRQLGDSVIGPSSDGSLLVAAYDRWGIAGLGRVIGDWSAVISDPRRRAIVLASDFSGVRSLYYHRRGNDVLWSRSLEALLGNVDASALDEQYVAGYLTVGGYPGRTPYAGQRVDRDPRIRTSCIRRHRGIRRVDDAGRNTDPPSVCLRRTWRRTVHGESTTRLHAAVATYDREVGHLWEGHALAA